METPQPGWDIRPPHGFNFDALTASMLIPVLIVSSLV
jgi:hypothetical protein